MPHSQQNHDSGKGCSDPLTTLCSVLLIHTPNICSQCKVAGDLAGYGLKEFGSESQTEEDVRRMGWKDLLIILRSFAALGDQENRLINVVEVGIREGILSERNNSMFVCWWDDPGNTEDMMAEKGEICHSALQMGRTMGPWTSRGLGIMTVNSSFLVTQIKASYLGICIAMISWNGEWERMLTSDSCSHWNNKMKIMKAFGGFEENKSKTII